jgi:hypothetical protein
MEGVVMQGKVDSWSNSVGRGTIFDNAGIEHSFVAADVIEAEPALPGALVDFTSEAQDGVAVAKSVRVIRRVELAVPSTHVVVTDIQLSFWAIAKLVLKVFVVSFVLWILFAALMVFLGFSVRPFKF